MHHRFTALLILLQLFTLPSMAQQFVSEVEQLREGILKAQTLLLQLEAKRDSLEPFPAELQDSASFRTAVDSLEQQYQDPQIFNQKKDSLSQAFTRHQILLHELDQAKKRLEEEIKKAIAKLGCKLLSGEATAALNSLQRVKTQK